jgi:hypothetical protein
MAKKSGFFSAMILAAALSACSSAPKNDFPAEKTPVPILTKPAQDRDTTIDIPALKRSLGLDRAAEALGLTEKAFNTCDAGYGYSNTHNCRRLYFTLVHIQLLCRDSEGTVSTGIDRADQTPISRRPVSWNLNGPKGLTETDGEGFAQIQSLGPSSQRTQRLKISVGNDFLYMRANEITKVVAPKSWCN